MADSSDQTDAPLLDADRLAIIKKINGLTFYQTNTDYGSWVVTVDLRKVLEIVSTTGTSK